MPTKDKEEKPTVEKPKEPETPEQTAARAAGVTQAKKEGEAAAALAGAETEGHVEVGKEKKRIQDIRYFHVDDEITMRSQVARALTEKLGMTGKAGEARSLQAAMDTIKKLAQEGQSSDLILLDRNFLAFEDDDMPNNTSGDQFLKQFEELAKDPQFKEKLKDTRIVMLTSHASDPQTMERFRKLSSRVIGGLEKTEEVDTEKLKAMLTEAGLVQESE